MVRGLNEDTWYMFSACARTVATVALFIPVVFHQLAALSCLAGRVRQYTPALPARVKLTFVFGSITILNTWR